MNKLGKHTCFVLALAACGPQVGSDSDVDVATTGNQGADDACASGSCPEELFCGDGNKICEGGFGITPCIDGRCGATPGSCYSETFGYRDCNEVCASSGATCVTNACEGVTAFSYPGPPERADHYGGLCGQGTPEVLELISRHDFACDEPLPWSEDVSLFQCCCDDPND